MLPQANKLSLHFYSQQSLVCRHCQESFPLITQQELEQHEQSHRVCPFCTMICDNMEQSVFEDHVYSHEVWESHRVWFKCLEGKNVLQGGWSCVKGPRWYFCTIYCKLLLTIFQSILKFSTIQQLLVSIVRSVCGRASWLEPCLSYAIHHCEHSVLIYFGQMLSLLGI